MCNSQEMSRKASQKHGIASAFVPSTDTTFHRSTTLPSVISHLTATDWSAPHSELRGGGPRDRGGVHGAVSRAQYAPTDSRPAGRRRRIVRPHMSRGQRGVRHERRPPAHKLQRAEESSPISGGYLVLPRVLTSQVMPSVIWKSPGLRRKPTVRRYKMQGLSESRHHGPTPRRRVWRYVGPGIIQCHNTSSELLTNKLNNKNEKRNT